MRQYQKENGIEKNCATNVQLLYDMIETNQFCKAKVKAVLVFSEDKNDIVATSYLVIELYDGTVIDPSYDTYSLKNAKHFDNFKDFMDIINGKPEIKDKIDINKIISLHVDYVKISEQLSKNGYVTNLAEYYDDQLDYVANRYAIYYSKYKKQVDRITKYKILSLNR